GPDRRRRRARPRAAGQTRPRGRRVRRPVAPDRARPPRRRPGPAGRAARARAAPPPVLDRGLGPALGILAGTSAIPVVLTVAVTERPSPAIEAMAYFCTAELLANVTKHSGASHVTISVAEPGSGLVLTVTDDGHGGARLVPGGGLAGLL